MRILCVCLGNICRSPTAEGVLRGLDPNLTVDSAGTSGWHVGDPPHRDAIRAARQRGYDIAGQQGRAFGLADYDAFDLILAMDAKNLRDIEMQRPDGNTTPVRLMLDYSSSHQGQDVPDPYYTGNFDHVLDLIEEAAAGVLRANGRA